MSDVVLVSGGVDSLVLAEMMRLEGSLSMLCQVIYMHPAMSHERAAVSKYVQHLYALGEPVERREVVLPINGYQWMGIGPGESGARVVPLRNAYMVVAAAHLAASTGRSRVLLGASGADSDNYADCRPQYIEALNEMSSPFGVTIEAPLAKWTRAQITNWAADMSPEVLRFAWSCYEPFKGGPCGECDSCVQGAA